jgi:hypothetical protein
MPGAKTKTTAGPGVGSIMANWKNKDYAKISLVEIQVAVENANTDLKQREFKFGVGIDTLEEGHSDWALREVDSCKQLLDHTNALYIAMLTTVKFRSDVKSSEELSVDVATKLTLALNLEKSVHKKWLTIREETEKQRDASLHLRSGQRTNSDDEDEAEEPEAPRGKKHFRLSNFDGLKPSPANERFTQTETDHWLEHSRVWADAINIKYQGVELQRIVFESIISESFRSVLVLKHPARMAEDGFSNVPEVSMTFEECLAEATRSIGVRQDQFVRRSYFFGMKKLDSESQLAFLRRCKDSSKRADLPNMTIEEHVLHAFMSSCGSKVREHIILDSRATKPTLTQVEAALSSREYITHLDSLDKKETAHAVTPKPNKKSRGRSRSKSPGIPREGSTTGISLKDLGCLRCGEDGHWKADCNRRHEDLTCTHCSKPGHVSKVCLKKIRETEKANQVTDSTTIEEEEEDVPAGDGEMGRISPGPRAHFSHHIYHTETADKQSQTEVKSHRRKASPPKLNLSQISTKISSGAKNCKRISVTMLVDRGRSNNILSLTAANKAGLTISKASRSLLTNSSGSPMTISGQCFVKMEVPDLRKTLYVTLLVTPDLLLGVQGVLGKGGLFLLDLYPYYYFQQKDTDSPPPAAEIPTIYNNTDVFTLKEKFHRVIKTTPGADQQQVYYLYREVVDLMNRYVKSKPHFINIKKKELSMLGNDPLSEVFGLKSLHTHQVPWLIQEQLQPTPFTSDSTPPKTLTQTNTAPPPPPPPATTTPSGSYRPTQPGIKRKALPLHDCEEVTHDHNHHKKTTQGDRD